MSGSKASWHMLPSRENVAGRWALDKNDSLVPAWDELRTPRGPEGHHHKYFCSCGCGASVALKRGDILDAHFAYIATDRICCRGGRVFTPESEAHYNAKWLLHDSFRAKTFRDVCGVKHVIETHTYTSDEWKAFVEKQIPGTRRIADVLLWNSSTKEAVALEVYQTHAVDQVKYDEVTNAGVRLIELHASKVNAGLHELDNIIPSSDLTTCSTCEQDRVRREEQERRDRKRREEQERRDDEKWEKRYEAARRYEEHERKKRVAQRKIAADVLNEWWNKQDPVQEFQDAQEEREDIQRKELEDQFQEFHDAREIQRKEREEIQRKEREEIEIERRAIDFARVTIAREEAKYFERVQLRQLERVTFFRKLGDLNDKLKLATTALRLGSVADYDVCQANVVNIQDQIGKHEVSGRGKRRKLAVGFTPWYGVDHALRNWK
jgi:hypothetical protein